MNQVTEMNMNDQMDMLVCIEKLMNTDYLQQKWDG